jgi:hypothetical protein
MKFLDYVTEIEDFFRSNGVQVDPVPQVKVDYTQRDVFDPFVPTGNYNPTNNTITIFVNNRQLKDILRSFCHELIHHNQNITNPEGFKQMNMNGTLQENDELTKIESDAYNRGNILFRKWTETHTH